MNSTHKDISRMGRWNLYQVEVIERFSWAALAGVLVAYLMAFFDVDHKYAYLLYTGASGMTYAIMVIGGYVATLTIDYSTQTISTLISSITIAVAIIIVVGTYIWNRKVRD